MVEECEGLSADNYEMRGCEGTIGGGANCSSALTVQMAEMEQTYSTYGGRANGAVAHGEETTGT